MALSERGNVYVWGTLQDSFPAGSRVVPFPELVTGLPDLLETNASSVLATFDPRSATFGADFGVELLSPPGAVLEVQTSPDLVRWTTVTRLANPTGRVRWTQPVQAEQNFFVRIHPGF